MNANEQLDFYNPDSIYYGNSRHYIQQLEAKVRQQQAEIEALKQIIDANNLNQNIGQFVKPTNEPVAWFEQDPNMKSIWYQSDQNNPNAIPLYTHPVKELTDEEILECWNETHPAVVCLNAELPLFARAILRKAQK